MAFIKQQATQSVAKDERKKPRTCLDLIAGLEDPNPVARRWMARPERAGRGARRGAGCGPGENLTPLRTWDYM